MARSKTNAPMGQVENLEPSFVKKTVSELTDIYNLPKPETDEEVRERINQFFSCCGTTGMRPGVELLALFLRVSRQSIFNWEHGIKCSPERQDMIVHAKAVINAFLEQSHLQGRLNPISAIFLSKAWLGYSDDVTVRIDTPQCDDSTMETLEQIALKRRLNPVSMPEIPNLEEVE